MKKAMKNNRLLIFGGAALALSLLIVPYFAGAQTGIITNIGVSVVTVFFKVVAGIFNFVFGYIFMLAGWLVEIATELNHQILMDSNALVKVGWGICRDIANLGFVLIMIVMAVATIVSYEKYAVQKLLPLLIGAAILVNFSLTIAGVLITFSDSLSATFTDRLTASTITDALAGAFNPQRLLLRDTENLPPPDPASQGSAFSDFSSAVLISISGLIFNVVFLAIATLSMATLALMLLYRYVYLSLLLVLAPLAWLFWVFPDLKYLFSDWWKNFIKWTFFLPASTFFLYLAVQSATALGKTQIFTKGGIFSTSGFASVMAQGAQMIVLTFLLLGGLIAAQKLGIHGADGAMKLAKKGKDATLGFAGRKALQYGSYPLRRKTAAEGSKSVAERLTDAASTAKNPVSRFMLGGLARGASRVATAGGENVLKEQEARVSKMSVPDVKAALTTAMGPFRVALVKRLSKEKQLGNVNMTSIATKDTAALFARFNQGREFSDIEKNGVMSVDMAEAIKSGNQEALAEATNKLVGSMTRKDLETASVKDLFSGKKKFGLEAGSVENLSQHFARALISENPGLVPSMVPKFDAPSRRNFTDTYGQEIDDGLKIATPGSPAFNDLTKMKKQFETVLANYTVGFSPVAEEAGGGGAAGGAPPAGGGGTPKP